MSTTRRRRPFPVPGFLTPALRSPYHWVALGLMTVVQGGDAWASNSVFVLYPFIQEDLALSGAQVGLISAAFLGGGLPTALPGGWLTDRWGVKRTCLASTGLAIVPTVGFGFAQSFWQMVVLAFTVGLLLGPVYAATSRAVIDWLPARRRGFGMGIKQTGPPVSSALAAVVFPAIALAAGWRAGPWTAAGLMGLVILLVLFAYRDHPGGGSAKARLNLGEVGLLVGNRNLMVAVVWAALNGGIQFVIISYFILYLVQSGGLSPVTAGSLAATAMLVSVVSRVVWGGVSDTALGGRRLPILGAMGLTSGAALALLSVLGEGTPLALFVVSAALIGLSTIAWMGLYTVFIGELAAAGRTATTLGFAQLFMRSGMIVMPPVFGLLVDWTGSYVLGWRIVAVVAFSATLAFLLLVRERRRPEEAPEPSPVT